MKKTLIVFVSLFFLTACFDYRELDELAIMTAMTIDKNDEGKFIITAAVMNPKNINQTEQSSAFVTYTSNGDTLHEALHNVTLQSPNKIILGHMQILMISEKVAQEGVYKILDLLIRDKESNLDFAVVVVRKNIDKILSVLTHQEIIPAFNYVQMIATSDIYQGTITKINNERLLQDLLREGIEPILPVLEIEADDQEKTDKDNISSPLPATRVVLSDMAVFKGDKLIGYLDSEQSLGTKFLIGSINNQVISFACDSSSYATIQITNIITKNDVIYLNNRLEVKTDLNVDAVLSEYNCAFNSDRTELVSHLEDLVEIEIKNILATTVETVIRDYNSDIFGFGRNMYKNDNVTWNILKKDWDTFYRNLRYSTDITVKISHTGSLASGLIKEK